MQVRIEFNSPLPVYVQLKEQIEFLVLNGELEPGTRLPTIRQLAGFLGVNRNTVQKAYQELAQAGLIECRRGRGCRVVDRPAAIARPISAQLLSLIDQAIEGASELGISPEHLASLLYARARQRPDVQVKRRVVFVECVSQIATAMAGAIQRKLDVAVTPLLLEDLRQADQEVERQIREADVVATTFFHIQEVRRLLAGERKEVVGLVVKPHLEKLIQIAQIPRGTPAALVCCSRSCAQDMRTSLENAGVTGLNTALGGVDEAQELARLLPGFSVVIASDFVADRVRPMLGPAQQLITLDYTVLDEGAVSLLRPIVAEAG
jgi:GntR family transcriptional regulator